jgi:catechol 2,3-dioxygenase-like lactoylglutathione lyase family enzyme
MDRKIAHITLVVKNYDEAIDFYVNKLNFNLIKDTILDQNKRWVLVSPNLEQSCNLLLAEAANDIQNNAIGNQSGGRVFLFLYTDNFKRDFQGLLDNKIKIVREPKSEPYGDVAVFEDLYGNLWDLIEPKNKN